MIEDHLDKVHVFFGHHILNVSLVNALQRRWETSVAPLKIGPLWQMNFYWPLFKNLKIFLKEHPLPPPAHPAAHRQRCKTAVCVLTKLFATGVWDPDVRTVSKWLPPLCSSDSARCVLSSMHKSGGF